MDSPANFLSDKPSKKLFTEKQIGISALLAGPIPPAILMYFNFKRLGKEEAAIFILAGALLLMVMLFYGLFSLPEEVSDKIPNSVFSAFYGILVYLLFRKYQKNDVENALATGASKGSNWQVVGYTLLGLLISMVIIFSFSFAMTEDELESQTFGTNTIYYDAGVSPNEVATVARYLKEVEFFTDQYQMEVKMTNTGTNLTLTFYMDRNSWDDDEFLSFFKLVRFDLAQQLAKEITVQFQDVSSDGQLFEKQL